MEITFSSVWCTFYVWWTAFYLRKWQILTHYPEVWEYNGHDFVLEFVIKYNRNYVCYVCEQHTLEHQLYLSWSKEESWMQTKVASWMYTRSCHLCSVCLKIRLALSVIWWWKPLLSMSGDQMNWLCLSSDDENHCSNVMKCAGCKKWRTMQRKLFFARADMNTLKHCSKHFSGCQSKK